MWKEFEVKMVFEHRLCGSVPQSKEIVQAWLKARMPKSKPEGAKSLEEIEREVIESNQETEERTTLSFQRDDDGLFVRGGTIKAHLKDCANQIKDVVSIKALRAKVANKVYVKEYKVHLSKENGCLTETDGSYEQPVHVFTPQGPRNALKVINYVEQPILTFTLRLLEDKEVTDKILRKIFEYGSVHGYGGERGMGEGTYTFSFEGNDGED
jgi:hypothetical protein